MSEKWRDVVGYEGIYEVSNTGLVRTHKDKRTYNKMNVVRKWRQRILKNKTPNGRDVRVSLWKDGKVKDFLLHRLVAHAFIPSIPGKDSINHIDGNPKNNHVDNLQWCDHLENNNHAFDNGLIKTGKEIILINKEDYSVKRFRSMTKASEYMGHSHGYIHGLFKRGVTENENYKIELTS